MAADYEGSPASPRAQCVAALRQNTSEDIVVIVCVRVCVQVNRPLSMKKDGIQTRKRKPKSMGGGHGGARPPSSSLSGTFYS